MPLAAAFRDNAGAVTQAVSAYQTNVVTVNTTITGVLNSSLPTLNTYPPDWSAFTTAYEQAMAIALSWVNTVMARLLDVPAEVQDYNLIVVDLLDDAQAQAATLENDPGNQAALLALNNDLMGVSAQLAIVNVFIDGAIKALTGFEDQLPTMAADLQTIATDATAAANADQAQIAALQSDIDNLNESISSLTGSIVALGIADGAAITLGGVATIAAWPLGALTWIVLGPVVAIATTYIALDAEEIKADQAKIAADQTQMSNDTADVFTLNALSSQFATLSTQSEQIETNLTAILTAWQALEADVADAIGDVSAAVSAGGSGDYGAVATDVTDALGAWNESYAAAAGLVLDLQANTAQLQLGMSADDIQAAMQEATSYTSIIEYYNVALA